MCAGSDAMDRTTANDSSFSALLELAASNSLDDFKAAVDSDVTAVDIAGLWFCRKIGSTQMSLHHRTPLMIAAAYGSLDVLRFIIDMSTSPVDRGCGPDSTTALHCAASGGAPKAADAVKILLSAGADPDSADSAGRRAADVVAGSPGSKILLHELLGGTDRLPIRALRISTSPSTTGSPPLSSSPGDGGSPSSDSTAPERKEYPVDPSLPDIKNSVYASDEFRIYSFKIRPCSRAYSHDWTECPFVHPGENARRRDPRKYNYSCVPCPDFRKGSCNRGDACEYAHGVFESWLHPAQYRTKLCKDGTSCNRRVCFFAHTNDELRTLYIPGGGVGSPRSVRALEMAMLSLLPVSPSAAAAGLSPVANGLSNPSMGWPQPSVPMLHLPSSNFQSSRLRSSLCARDMPPGDFSSMLEVDDVCFSPSHTRPSLFSGINTKSLPSTNLDNLFSAEVSSPRYNSTDSMYSPSHKAALLNQLHQHQQTILSPINTRMYSPRSMEPQQQHASMLQSSLGLASPGRMSPRSIEQLAITAQREKLQQQQQQLLRCLSDHNLGSGSPSSTKWGSSTGKLDWGVNGEELDRLKNAPFELDSGGGGVDVSWVQSMLSSPDKGGEVVVNACNGDPSIGDCRANLNSNCDPSIGDHRPNFNPHRPNFNPLPLIDGHPVLDSWLEQMQLDHA